MLCVVYTRAALRAFEELNVMLIMLTVSFEKFFLIKSIVRISEMSYFDKFWLDIRFNSLSTQISFMELM